MSEPNPAPPSPAEIDRSIDRSSAWDRDDTERRREFERLIEELRPDLYRYAFWLARDPTTAEDVVQEALLRAWRALGSLRDEGSAKQWLMTIVRREHARIYEHKRLEKKDLDELTAAEQWLIATTDDTELLEMREAILSLEDGYREPLALQVLMGFKTQEIASIMDIAQGAVLTRLFRARQKLKAKLGLADGE